MAQTWCGVPHATVGIASIISGALHIEELPSLHPKPGVETKMDGQPDEQLDALLL